jgi:Phage tail tube protein
MTIQSDSSVGYKKESTYGTGVTVDRFAEFMSESFDLDRVYYQGQGNRVGARTARSGRRALISDGAKGDLSLEVPSRGIGTLFELLMGVAVSTVVPATSVYHQLFTPIKNDYLPSATFQKGIPRLGANTVDTYTMRGMVCSSFDLSLATDVLKLNSSWVGKELDTAVAYATPSYAATQELFTFVGASLIAGGSPTLPTATALSTGGTTIGNIRDFTINVDNGLDTNGRNIGGLGKLSRSPAVGGMPITGTMTAEYDAIAYRDAIVNQTPFALVATFQAPTLIQASYYPTVQIMCPDIRFEGELPKATNGDVITQALSFTAFDKLDGSAPLYISIRTADTAL